MIYSKNVLILILFSFASQLAFADCVEGESTCNDTHSIRGANDIIVPVVGGAAVIGLGLWYLISKKHKNQDSRHISTTQLEEYKAYNFSFSQTPNNNLSGIQMNFTYEF